MPCCDTGRNIQKYKGGGASTLQDALENGNTASLNINLSSPAIFIGDGGGLSNINASAVAGNLQAVTDNGATTTNKIIITNGATSLETSGNIVVSTNVYATEFYGDGGTLSNIAANKNFQEVTDIGATTSNKITLTNSVTSLETSGNVSITGNVTASKFYGDGTTLTGVALSTDLASNSTRIGNLETNLTNNSTRITTVTNNLTNNVIRIGNLETNLTNNSSRIGNLETNITNNSTRITTVTNNLTNNVIRIGNLETNLTNNSSRIGNLETNLTNNSTRITTVTNNLTNNVIRIGNLETNLTNNSSRIGTLETDMTSNASRINTLETEIQPVNRGGTNITTYAIGDILIASATDTLSKLSLGTGGYVLTSNSTSGLPEWKSSSDLGTEVAQLSNGSYILGGAYNGITPEEWSVQASTSNTADYIVARDSSGDIFVSNVNAINIRGDGSGITNSNASNISLGTLAVARGGTGFTSYAIGDILYASSPSALSKLAPSTAGYFLKTNGTGNAPTWENVADIGSATPANLYTDDYITGGPWSGLTDANIRVLGNVSNLSNQLVARDNKGDIFVSNVNAIQYYGDGGTLSNISGSQDLHDVITIDPYTNSPPYFGAGSYGAIYGSNTINASTISTTIGFYGPIKGSNTITTSGVYGPIYGSNTINAGTISTATGFYGPINGSNTISGTTLNVDSLISDDASAINKLNASNVTTGTLSVDYGGTNITTYAKGDILIASATDTLSNLSLGTGGYVLTSNSTSGLPEWKSSSDLGTQVAQLSNGSYILGGSYNGINPEEWSVQASTSNTADYIVARDSSGDIFVSNVNAINIRGDGSGITNSNASNISLGTLAVARGGTGFTSYAIGDILYASSPSALSKLAPSTAGYFLKTNGTGNAPTWENVADIGSATPANLYTDDYITGGPWSGLTDANIRVLGNVSNLSNQLVARDNKGDIFVSNVNAIQYYGDGGTLSNISGSQDLHDVITIDPYTNSPPYFGAGSYGAIYGSNTINASTISTTIGFYGPIKGSNTITTSGVYGPIYGSNTINASTISTTIGFYGPIKGSNTITTSGVYGPIYGSNTINASTISTTIGFYGPIKGSNTITTSGVYGPIYGSNTINASTISTTIGFYGPIKGSNTITTSGVYGPIYGSNTINASTISTTIGFYGPIKGSNTITTSGVWSYIRFKYYKRE